MENSTQSPTVVMIVAVTLAIVVVGGLGLCALLSAIGAPIPDILPDAIKVALGSLGTLLATTRVGVATFVQQGREQAAAELEQLSGTNKP
jgi:hypothetical protein